MVIASVVSVISIGRWSDTVMGLGLIVTLCIALSFDMAMSGVLVLFWVKKVGTFGPRCIALPFSIKVAKPLPTLLFRALPIRLCLAFKSPKYR